MTGVPRVLYVTGWCRSGTTLLGNVLGELDGVVHVGELRYLWTNAVLRRGTNAMCGCGSEVGECPLWTQVIRRVAGVDPVDHAEGAVRRQQTALRTRHTIRRLAEACDRRRARPVVRMAVLELIELYEAITEVANARLIVDTGKFPAEAAVLCGRPDVDARVLHMVRDPRATAESWRRAKAYIPAMGPVRSTAYWVGFNLVSDRIGRAFPERYLRVRYEDFAARPRQVLDQILDLAGLAAPSPVRPDRTATLGINHTVTGNPDRLRRGVVHIAEDGGWRRTQSGWDRRLVTALAAPLLGRYGYRFTAAAPVVTRPETEEEA